MGELSEEFCAETMCGEDADIESEAGCKRSGGLTCGNAETGGDGRLLKGFFVRCGVS